MKKITIYHCMLPIVAASFFCLTSYIKQNGIDSQNCNRNTMFTDPIQLVDTIPYVHSYETDENKFYNGEILLPDMVHADTLQVINADFLNEMIIEDKYEIASDGDIYEVLAEGTVLFCDYPGYMAIVSKK